MVRRLDSWVGEPVPDPALALRTETPTGLARASENAALWTRSLIGYSVVGLL